MAAQKEVALNVIVGPADAFPARERVLVLDETNVAAFISLDQSLVQLSLSTSTVKEVSGRQYR